jgi:hypothetical protein
MIFHPSRRLRISLAAFFIFAIAALFPSLAAGASPKVYIVLWFDTEDYMLPASDDTALHLADFLSHEHIRATFKVVGEKARTLERRGRKDVIAALKKHEIGYHANYHSVQPTPAMYLSDLGWDEGVAEFDRRERGGVLDIERIFGVAPSCYGQPGSSWGPQVFGAMKKWGMNVYLDAGSHVKLDDRPFYYGGILNLYKLEHQLRADLHDPKKLPEAEARFVRAHDKLVTEGGGIISIYYHPCEFAHKEFWDGVNFRNGANPPRELWKAPPAQTPEESKAAFDVFENYIRFIERYSDVQFVTATEAFRLYQDKAKQRSFTASELKEIAQAVKDDIIFQRYKDYALAPSEIFYLFNRFIDQRLDPYNDPADRTEPGSVAGTIVLSDTPHGPSRGTTHLTEPVVATRSQFDRTVSDVTDFLRKHRRIPTSVWLGSKAVPPESFLLALAEATIANVDHKRLPETITLKPARLAAAKYVSDDGPHLWGWIIFPHGFRAPAMMELAKRQAWTLKPALLNQEGNGSKSPAKP